MNILIAPISGGAFPGQLGGLKALCEAEYDTNLILASSGGNVSSYITCAADFNSYKINTVLEMINPKLFIEPWVPAPLPNPIVGFFQGSLYKQGYGSQILLETFFTSESITKREIWTGTYNRTQGNSTFFCNRSKARSIFGQSTWDLNLLACNEPIYLDGNIKLISNVANASASIPSVVEPRSINGVSYVDGGLYCASPLTAMRNIILEKTDNFHMIYVNSYNINNAEDGSSNYNILGVSKWATDELVKGHIVSDRLVAYSMLQENVNQKVSYQEGSCSVSVLRELLNFTASKKRTLIELYPKPTSTLNITNFTSSELIQKVDTAKTELQYRLWYI